MKVKDLVDVFGCEVIIESESKRKAFGNMFECYTERYYRGDIEDCPEDVLELDVNYLTSEYEDIITVNVYSKIGTAYRDVFMKEDLDDLGKSEYVKSFLSDFISTHNLLVKKDVLASEADLEKSYVTISKFLKLFFDAGFITFEESEAFKEQIIISN